MFSDPTLASLAAMVLGLCLLVVGGELLVRGASRLAAALSVPPLVVGLTVVAFGTSAPELAVSVKAAWSGNADLAVGNVVGSNIFNVLFILGCSAIIIPLTVSIDLIRRDVPLMILASCVLWGMSVDGSISRGEAAALTTGLIAYTVSTILTARRSVATPVVAAPNVSEAPMLTESAEPSSGAVPDQPVGVRQISISLVLAAVGLALLAAGSDSLVGGAVQIAGALGVSQLVIGLTIVAAGTSLPEVVTSLVAAVRGERDLAVGNVVGSNLFNILCVLGVSGLLSEQPIPVSDAARQFDLPVMTAVAVACLPVSISGHSISRWEGILFVAVFVVYLAIIIAAAGTEQWTVGGTTAMWLAAPLLLLAVLPLLPLRK